MILYAFTTTHRPLHLQRHSRIRRPIFRRCEPEEKADQKVVDEEENKKPIGTSSGLFSGGFYEKRLDPRLFGDDVDSDIKLPPEYEKDFWEDPQFQIFAGGMQFAIPVFIVLGLLVGGIAAKSYNEGATAFLQPASSENTSAEIIRPETD